MYRNNQDLTTKLIRIAHKIIDNGNELDGEQILEIAHEVAGRSLYGSVPQNNLMTSLQGLLDAQKIEWTVIGAVAVFVHGTPRETQDIDVLVSSLPDPIDLSNPRYMEKFDFYRSKSSTGKILTIDHKQSGQIELLVANNGLEKSAIKNSSPEWILGKQVPVVNAAHLIALKVQAWTENPKRGAKDRTDIVSIWETSHPDLTPIFSLLNKEELENLKKTIPDAFPPE